MSVSQNALPSLDTTSSYTDGRGSAEHEAEPICPPPELSKGATNRLRKPWSLTGKQFQTLAGELEEPFRTMALVAVCFGLRVSELLGLQWHVSWIG